MFIMWFSGLRGAIAYALSLHLEFDREKRRVLVTTTLIIVLFTILVLGGSTMPLLKWLKGSVIFWFSAWGKALFIRYSKKSGQKSIPSQQRSG